MKKNESIINKMQHTKELWESLQEMKAVIEQYGVGFSPLRLGFSAKYQRAQRKALRIIKLPENYAWFKGRDFIRFRPMPLLIGVVVQFISLIGMFFAPKFLVRPLARKLVTLGIDEFLSMLMLIVAIYSFMLGFLLVFRIFSKPYSTIGQYIYLSEIIDDLKPLV